MTEADAHDWVRTHFGVPRETALAAFAKILERESSQQNLISASTLVTMWSRHLVDSAQLIPLTNDVPQGAWLDVGSGAGLPGMVVALLVDREVILVEPRIRRVEFLRSAAEELGAINVTVIHSKAECHHPPQPAAIISARAVAELSQLLTAAQHCSDPSTVWVLPKGRNAQSEVEAARRKWQGSFHVEPSITQPDSGIVVAKGVRPK